MITDNVLTSDAQIDQIIGTISSDDFGTISVNAISGIAVNLPTGINDTCLFDGRFRVQSVGIWTPIGSASPIGTGDILLSNVQVTVSTTPSNIRIAVSNSSDASQVVEFEIILIAKTNQSGITPGTLVQDASFTSQLNYLKIYDQDVFNIVVPDASGASSTLFATSAITIPHPLNVVPMFKVWAEHNSILRIAQFRVSSPFSGSFRISPSIYTSYLLLNVFNLYPEPSENVNIHYRIYYDN